MSLIGTRILDFKLTRRIKAGGMGVVYEAEQVWGGHRKVAVKFLLDHLTDDENVRRRFFREAEILEMLDHPNIVRIIGLELDQDAIVMEFVEGQTLADILHNDPKAYRAPQQAVDLFSPLLDAFSYAHHDVSIHGKLKQGIIHRDIKPANVIVQPDGSPKILDFGISRIANFQSTLTDPKLQIGSVAYMSPEQITTPSDVDWRSDIYSLGVMLWETISGYSPYPVITTSEQVTEVYKQICSTPLPSLLDTITNITPDKRAFFEELNKVITQATAKNRTDRYANCAEMKLAIQNALKPRILAISFDSPLSDLIPESISQPEPIPQPDFVPNTPHLAEDSITRIFPSISDKKRTTPGWLILAVILGGFAIGTIWFISTHTNIFSPFESTTGEVMNDPITSVSASGVIANADSLYIIGNHYFYGTHGVEKNQETSADFYKKSAEAGSPAGQNRLGLAYQFSYGVPQDYKKALVWYRRAAEKSNILAQNNLGRMLDSGLGTLQNKNEAVYWYRQAAVRGLSDAQYNLGLMYERGEGVKPSRDSAMVWYRLAAQQGDSIARQALQRLATRTGN